MKICRFLTLGSPVAWMIFALTAVVLTGCDDSSSPSGPNDPFAVFVVDVTEAASAFTATTTNSSTNHEGGKENLGFLWEVQGQDDTNIESPQYTYTYIDLGLDDIDDEALREFKLTVTENNDPSRRSSGEKNILFRRTKAGGSAAIVDFAAPCEEGCRVYHGDGVYSGEKYLVVRVLYGRLD